MPASRRSTPQTSTRTPRPRPCSARPSRGSAAKSLEIFTKVYFPTGPQGPNDTGLSRKHIIESINGSLKRLGTDYVDLYQAHRYDYETPLEETIQAFADVVRQGKALYIGVSEWTAEQLREGHALAKSYGIQLISNQPQYSDAVARDRGARSCRPRKSSASRRSSGRRWRRACSSGKYLPGQPVPEGSRATDEKSGANFIKALPARRRARGRAAAEARRRAGRPHDAAARDRVGAAEPERRRPRWSAHPVRSSSPTRRRRPA